MKLPQKSLKNFETSFKRAFKFMLKAFASIQSREVYVNSMIYELC